MKRQEAIEAIVSAVDDRTAVLSSLGLISREIFECHDGPNRFYVPGSMGLASAVGLGLAVCRPDIRVLVVDGDASLLMNLGSLVTTAYQAPLNFIHVVLDNRAFASCSEETTLSGQIGFDDLAKSVGFPRALRADEPGELVQAIRSAWGVGPTLILVRIELGGRRDFARPLDAVGLKKRFMDFLGRSDRIR